MTQLFLDCEFTGLVQHTELISLCLYEDEESYFYAEFNDFDRAGLTPWLQENVMRKLFYASQDEAGEDSGSLVKMKGNKKKITAALKRWLAQFEMIEIWADVPAYDWVLFCELFGGARDLPSNIFYVPFDLATVLRLRGDIKPAGQYAGDISRYELAGMDSAGQHNALEDCRAEKACLEKIKTK